MINIKKATTTSDFKTIELLAEEILHEVYDPIIPAEHTVFFLQKFQTVSAIQEQIEKENFQYYLLYFNDIPVGYIGFYIKESILYLSKIYILEISRGNKIGKTALQFIQQKAEDSNVNTIELLVNQQNKNTIAIYKKYGFKVLKAVSNSFSDGFTVEDYIMEKEMNTSE
jgi:ribosomal protein S18 acetylase RimI-like enzyme